MISIIITTKNEQNNIKRLLLSIDNQINKKKTEVIVVDNFSDDETLKIVSEFKYIKTYQHGPERSAQRNFGIKKSTGRIILILDADMELSENLLNEIELYFQFNNSDAIYIEEKIISNGLMGKIRKLERKFYIGTHIDCARAFLSNTIKSLGGYDESLTGPEDWDLDNKLLHSGKKIDLLKNRSAYINHYEVEVSIFRYLFKKNYYSQDHNKFRKKWKDTLYLKKQLGIVYRFFFVFIENNKYTYIIRSPVYFILMYLVLTLKALIGFKNYLKKE